VVPARNDGHKQLIRINAEVTKVIEQGGSVRGITDINYADIAPAQRSWTLAKI